MDKLIAIDGNSLLYRAYFALPDMTSNSGKPTGALYGFMSMLTRLLSYDPTHMAVAFDMHAPTFRHLKYNEYKAGRAETPPELREQFDMLKELLRAMKITVCECEGYEADDILGTLAAQADRAGMTTLIVTGDKDALQLVSESTHVIFTRKGASDITEYDEALLREKYGLMPKQMIDLKGLMGDSSDNIPGIKGVGEKTALKLLEKYGTLEEALTRGAIEEKGALQRKLAEGAQDARLSYFLGTINTAAPVSITLEECVFDRGNMSGGIPMLAELQMKNIISRLPKQSEEVKPVPVPQTHDIKNVEICTSEELRKVLSDNSDAKTLAFNFGSNMSFAFDAEVNYELATGGTLLEAGLDIREMYSVFSDIFKSESIKKIVFDAKNLMHILHKYGIELKGLGFDAMIADYLLNAVNPSKTFEELCSARRITPCASALFTLAQVMAAEIESSGMKELYENVELPLIEVLYSMEEEGFRADEAVLAALGEEFSQKRDALEKQIYEEAHMEFNIQSPKQLSEVLFEELKLPPPKKKTKLGYSTSADVLENYEDDFPIVKMILDYRFYAKLIGTFTDGMLSQINKKTGRIYTTFNQNVTATGRISSTEPNLQTIPTRTEAGRKIRRAFVASEGNVLVDADYSQIELRVLAHMSDDKLMTEAFHKGEDIHTRTAAEVLGIPQSEVTKQQRSAAKAVNFGIVYGISDFGLAKQLGISRKTAGSYISRYLERYSGIDNFMHKCVKEAEEKGYAVTLSGRRRSLFELRSSNFNTRSFGKRIAMNMPVQGSAADIIKIAMVKVYRALNEQSLKAKLVLQIHDELIVDTPQDEVDKVKGILQSCMESAYALKVPLVADVETGKSWYDAK